jgi:hypothetical protein
MCCWSGCSFTVNSTCQTGGWHISQLALQQAIGRLYANDKIEALLTYY